MKKHLYILLMSLIMSAPLQGTHLMGGDVSYKRLGGNQFEITFTIYRDCKGAGISSNLNYNIIRGSSLNNNYISSRATQVSKKLLENNKTACLMQGDYCVEVYLFKDTITLDPDPMGYFIRYSSCCRNNSILSLTKPPSGNMQQGQVWQAKIPTLEFINSSPVFLTAPIPYLCVGRQTVFNHGVFDPDGDSLVFSLSVPKKTGNPPDYDDVIYRQNYSVDYPFGFNSPKIEIDPITGEVTVTAHETGNYVVAIEVKEYRIDPVTRQATYLGKVVRDLQFIVLVCIYNPAPEFVNDSGGRIKNLTVNQEFCFTITAQDIYNSEPGSKPYDTLYLTGTGSMLGNSFNQVQPPLASFNNKTAYQTVSSEFCWTPVCHHITLSSPHLFIVNVEDQGCNTIQNTFIFYVKPERNIETSPLQCLNVNNNEITLNWTIDTPYSDLDIVYVFKKTGEGMFNLLDSISALLALSYTDKNVINKDSVIYSYYIKLKNGCGLFGSLSDTLSTLMLNIEYIDDKHALLFWNKVSSAENEIYYVYYNHGSGFFLLDSTYHTYYIYSACSFKGDFYIRSGTCNLFSPVRKIIFEDITPPENHTINNTSVNVNTKIDILFPVSDADDAAFYRVMRSQNGSDFIFHATVNNNNENNYLLFSDDDVNTSLNHYCYNLMAEDSCGNVSSEGAIHCPVLLSGKTRQLANYLEWINYTGYQTSVVFLERLTDTAWIRIATFSNGEYYYLDEDAICDVEYKYRIKSVKYDESEVSFSNIVTLKIMVTEFPEPVYFKSASVSVPNKVIHLQWEKSENFEVYNYKIYRKLTSDDQFLLIYSTTDVDETGYFDHTEVEEGMCYYVVTVDICGRQSAKSNEACPVVVKGKSGKFINNIWWNPYREWENNVLKYDIYRADDGSFPVNIGVVDSEQLTFTDTDLADEVNDYCYFVKAIEKNGSYSDALSTQTCLHQEPVIHIPNVFTPTASAGINDQFAPTGMYIKSFDMKIFNRWGELVFETTESKPWSGNLKNGNRVMNGAYVYLITINSFNGNRYYYHGTVTVLD